MVSRSHHGLVFISQARLEKMLGWAEITLAKAALEIAGSASVLTDEVAHALFQEVRDKTTAEAAACTGATASPPLVPVTTTALSNGLI